MSYTPKHYANVTDLTANNLNELELAVSEAHEDIDILQKQMTNLQLDNPEVLKQLNEVLNNTSDAFTLLKDIENAMTEQPDLSAILKQNSANFLTKTSQSLTNTEKKQILKNLGLNKYHFLENIYVNGTQLTGTSLNLTVPTIDTVLNKNSNNAISNAVVAEALENIKIPDITPLLTDYATIDFVEKKAFNAITAEMLLRQQGDIELRELLESHSHTDMATKTFVRNEISLIPTPDVSGQINAHNTNISAHQDIRDAIKNIDLSGYALIDHNHDEVYAPATHSHPYASEDHTHDYADSDHTHDDYLPLTAGSSKAITGDLYVKDGTNTKNIYLGKTSRLRDNGGGGFILSTNGAMYLRCNGDGGYTTGLVLDGEGFKPQSNNGNSLGISTNRWKEIHGTTIYQNGKQVANKEDIPSLEGYATEGYVDTKDTEINNRIDEVENSIPVNISELNNDSQFITNTVSNLTYYYTKSQSYTKDEINSLISNIKSFNALIVSSLPTEDISTTTIYLLSKTDSEDNDYYDEYLYINNTWEMIGNTKIDLSNHYTKTEIDTQMENVVTLDGEQALTNKTYEGYTLGAACAKGTTSTVSSSSSSLITSAGVASYLSGKTIITKSDQYIRITDLSTGVYKLTYSGTKYLYYSGTSSTLSCTVVAGTGAVLLYVSRYNSTYWNWFYINGGGTGGFPYIYFGYTSSNGGNYSSNSLSSLLTSANLPYLNNTRMGTSSKFYAPTTGGTSGYILKSNGATAAPTWEDISNLMTSDQVIAALGFTPYNSTNPNGYITSSGSITGNAATATKATQDGNGDIITATYAKISDLENYVPNTRTINGKALSANISLGNKDVGALPDYTLTINHGTAGNPRMVKFASVNYSSVATCFKMAAMTCHDNGVSYQFLTDMLIAVTTAGEVTANIYKFAQQSVGNVDGVARYTGDVFYVNDTTNKIVDFYILCGQYSSSQFTPVTKVGSTNIAYVTQYSGTATYYSSGTKVWVNGCGTTYARLSDIPTNYVTTNTTQTITGSKTFTGTTSTMDINCYSTLRMINGSNNALMWNIITDTNGNLVFKHS